ncbi:MAG TPA: hypothetical protein VFQ50_06490 [Flavobacterium sp.]|jgi:Rad3-related DNA helicase|nr:hypothetical protein [Flavobacterium sp.]
MGIFGSKIKKIVAEIRKISEYYSNDLNREINESFTELKSAYDENKETLPEVMAFFAELKPKLTDNEAEKLEQLLNRLSKLNKSAKNGVEAMWELSRNQRKLTSESMREFEQYEY